MPVTRVRVPLGVLRFGPMSNQYHLDRYHRRRLEAIAILGGRCVRCGAVDCLEIDHVDRATKSFDLSKRWGVAQATWLAELAKCQLLCEPCHKAKTVGEMTTRQHGTHAMYRKGGCRCDECVTANTAYMKAIVASLPPRRTCGKCGRRTRRFDLVDDVVVCDHCGQVS